MSHLDSCLLIVDDNPMNVLFLTKLLGKSGYTNVRTTQSPVEAEQMALELRPDLAIIDLHMPGMSGYELLQRLRNQTDNGFLPILVFTADATGDARRRALELGATDFLTKPGDPSEITLRVRNFLEMRYMYRALENQNEVLEERVRERTQRLEEAQLEIAQRLARAGDYRDDQTGDHCRRVGELSYQIALNYGLSKSESELIRTAAPLHDIGKVAISDAILRKPARLSEEEFADMKRHTQIGAEILANSSSEILRLAHEIALTHHERWDGTGYGRGLRGDEIPIAGRIVAVADAYDALTSERTYKPVWPAERAIEEIVRGSGSHFDPSVVEAFLMVVGDFEDRAA